MISLIGFIENSFFDAVLIILVRIIYIMQVPQSKFNIPFLYSSVMLTIRGGVFAAARLLGRGNMEEGMLCCFVGNFGRFFTSQRRTNPIVSFRMTSLISLNREMR